MATFHGTRRTTEFNPSATEAEGSLTDAVLDVVVIALIAAGFVTLAFNTIARL